MNMIKRMFGAKASDADTAAPNPVEPHAGGADFDAQVHTRRELVRVRTRNTLRLSGIPENWIDSQILLEPGGGRTFLHLHLVVRHWDERLQRYGVALQSKLMDEIERIDPQARQWLLSISWHYPPDLVCPYPNLPQPSVWIDAAPAQAGQSEVDADIALLFEVRDAELARPGK